MRSKLPKFFVGDRVTTKFTGKITKHVITKTARDQICESGFLYWIDPTIDSSGDGLDENWFAKSVLNKQPVERDRS